MTKPKETAVKKPTKAQQAAAAGNTEALLEAVGALQKEIAELRGTRGGDEIALSREEKTTQAQKLYLRVSAICKRNRVEGRGLFNFVVRMIGSYGLVATDEGVRVAEDLVHEGDPSGMIAKKAKEFFDLYGNNDAEFLRALAFERQHQLVYAASDDARAAKQAFLASVVAPYTDRKVSALSRLEFYNIVRAFCQEHPETYDYRLIWDYFDRLIAEDAHCHAPIDGPEDVPTIDFDHLRGEPNAHGSAANGGPVAGSVVPEPGPEDRARDLG
jgi:hypothetical protein